jgi:hypothetical protein
MTSSSANNVWAIGQAGEPRHGAGLVPARHGRRHLWNRTMSFCSARPPTPRMMPAAVGFSTPVAPPKQTATLTLIEHFDGTSWAVVPSPNVGPNSANQSNGLLGLTANSANNIWAFGSYFRGRRIGTPDDIAFALGREQLDDRIQSQKAALLVICCGLELSHPQSNVWLLGSGHDEALAIHMTTGTESNLVSSFCLTATTRTMPPRDPNLGHVN